MSQLRDSSWFWCFVFCLIILAWLASLTLLLRFVVSVADEPVFWLTFIPVLVATTCAYAACVRSGQIAESERRQAKAKEHDDQTNA